MSDTTKYLTKEKFDELTRELDLLRTVKRKEIAQSLEYARALGDLSENAEYHEAREAQANAEGRIAEIENVLKHAQIVEERKHGELVVMGSDVTVEKSSGEKMKVKIVGSEDANVSEGKISNSSPLGAAILGKVKGDTAIVLTPKGKISYKIVSVE
jgi:transcription elongation factor GreA